MNEELKKLLAEYRAKYEANHQDHPWSGAVGVSVKAIGDNQIEAIIATNSIDRHGEVLEIEGVDLKQYKKNPVVLWAHDYSKLPVARSISIKKQDGQIVSKMEFNPDDEESMKVYKAIKNGFVNAFSIGFIPVDGFWDEKINGYRWTKSEMIEYSVVPVPANPEALIQAKKLGLKLIEENNIEMASKEDIAEIKSMIGSLSDILTKASSATGDIVAQVTEQGDGRSPQKRKILLVKAKKTAQIVDKAVEMLIGELKKELHE